MASDGSTDEAIAKTLHVSVNTVERTRKQFCEENLELTLSERPRSGKPLKVTGFAEAYLIATTVTQGADWKFTLDTKDVSRPTCEPRNYR
jgi:transposase